MSALSTENKKTATNDGIELAKAYASGAKAGTLAEWVAAFPSSFETEVLNDEVGRVQKKVKDLSKPMAIEYIQERNRAAREQLGELHRLRGADERPAAVEAPAKKAAKA